MNNQVTIIEITADFLCIIILGDKTSIEDLISNIKKNNPNDKTQYMAVKIDNPSANTCYEITKTIENNKSFKPVLLDDGVETAQCYTYAEGYHKQLYMLMMLDDKNDSYIFGYPKIELSDDEDPELLVEEWFEKKINKIPNGIKKNMKLITVVGSNTNILVIATKINTIKKKKINYAFKQ